MARWSTVRIFELEHKKIELSCKLASTEGKLEELKAFFNDRVRDTTQVRGKSAVALCGSSLGRAKVHIADNKELLTNMLLFRHAKVNQQLLEAIRKGRIADLKTKEKLVIDDVVEYQYEFNSVISFPFDFEELEFKRLPDGLGYENEPDLTATFASDVAGSYAGGHT